MGFFVQPKLKRQILGVAAAAAVRQSTAFVSPYISLSVFHKLTERRDQNLRRVTDYGVLPQSPTRLSSWTGRTQIY